MGYKEHVIRAEVKVGEKATMAEAAIIDVAALARGFRTELSVWRSKFGAAKRFELTCSHVRPYNHSLSGCNDAKCFSRRTNGHSVCQRKQK